MDTVGIDFDYIAVCISAGRKENYSFLRNYLSESKALKMQVYLENKPEALYDVMQSLSNDEVIGVIRSFIVAEKFVATWPAKDKNPAFVLYKQLLRRAPELRNDLDSWIKMHTNSRCYLHYKLANKKSIHLSKDRPSTWKIVCLLLAFLGILSVLAMPLLGKQLDFVNGLSMVIIFSVYSLIAIILFVILYGIFNGLSSAKLKNTQADDILEMIESRKDKARALGIPDLFGVLFHKHLKFYPKWLAAGQKDKICPLVSEITKESDNDLCFVLNGHAYKICFLEHQMFSSVDDVSTLRADFELYTQNEKILCLKMTKEGYGYDSEWQVVDITAFKENDWLQDFLDLKERIDSTNDKDSQKTQEEKVNKLKTDFGL